MDWEKIEKHCIGRGDYLVGENHVAVQTTTGSATLVFCGKYNEKLSGDTVLTWGKEQPCSICDKRLKIGQTVGLVATQVSELASVTLPHGQEPEIVESRGRPYVR